MTCTWETRALRRRPSVAENKQGRGTDKVVFRLQASSLAWGQSFHIVGVNSDTHLDCCLTEMLFLMSQIEGKTANNRRRAPNDKTVLLKKKKILLSARLNNRWRSRPAGFWIYRAVTEVLSPHKDAVYSTEASERKKKHFLAKQGKWSIIGSPLPNWKTGAFCFNCVRIELRAPLLLCKPASNCRAQ